AGAAGVRRGDAEVVGRVGGQRGDRRRDGDVARARSNRLGARGAGAVARGGPVFELAFAHFATVGVDVRVERGGGLRDRRGGFGFDCRRVGERFQRLVGARARAAGVRGRDAEVVGGVRGEARNCRGDSNRGGAGAGRRRARS